MFNNDFKFSSFIKIVPLKIFFKEFISKRKVR